MTVLSDVDIRRALKEGGIRIDPAPSESQFTTSALDLMLGDEIYELKSHEELSEDEPAGVQRRVIVDPTAVDVDGLLSRYGKPLPREADGSFLLEPGRFVLGITRETVTLPRRARIAARVEGRSTLARLGLVVHLTAPTVHAGFDGKIVLEMFSFGKYPLKLVPGKLAICQLIFEDVRGAPGIDVKTRFQGQRSIRKSRR